MTYPTTRAIQGLKLMSKEKERLLSLHKPSSQKYKDLVIAFKYIESQALNRPRPVTKTAAESDGIRDAWPNVVVRSRGPIFHVYGPEPVLREIQKDYEMFYTNLSERRFEEGHVLMVELVKGSRNKQHKSVRH